MRTCKKCGVSKPLEAFQVYDAERGRRRHECRECTAERYRGYAAHSVEQIRKNSRRHYEANREKIIERSAEWAKENPDKRRKIALSHYYRLQDEAIKAYGGYVCSWCGIDEPLVLSIDHIDNNGAAHRKELGFLGGARFYKWLRDRGFPQGFQVLCMNCNHAKHRNKGVLPASLKGRCND